MKSSDKICHQISIKSAKQKDNFARRQCQHIEGTPKIILGKFEDNIQQIWIDNIKNEPIGKLKEFGTGWKAFTYGRVLISACSKLSKIYGNFIVNQNMIFFNANKEMFIWINPDIIQNQVKIYLPNNVEGELAMVQSIIIYLKLWIKLDFGYLSSSQSMEDLMIKFSELREKASKQMKGIMNIPSKEFFANRKQAATQLEGVKFEENKSIKIQQDRKVPSELDPTQFKETNKALSNRVKFVSHALHHPVQHDKDQMKNKTTLSKNTDKISDTQQPLNRDYQHKTFHNQGAKNNGPSGKSSSFKPSNYFPNKTASSSNGIVNYIRSNLSKEDEFKNNKLMLSDQEMEEMENERMRGRQKHSLDQVGEDLNDLFSSWMAEDQNEEEIKNMEKDLERLL